MKHRHPLLFVASLLFGFSLLLPSLSGAGAPEDAAKALIGFELFEHYEAIRTALRDDTLTGVAESARVLQERAKELAGPSAAEDRQSLETLASAAESFRSTQDLDHARELFSRLTAPLLELRHLAPDAGPLLAFCPMANEHWLQPAGEIGNPYYGQLMAKCGEFVVEE